MIGIVLAGGVGRISCLRTEILTDICLGVSAACAYVNHGIAHAATIAKNTIIRISIFI